CFYPAGYVEPVPHFWSRLGEMATLAGALVERTSYPDGRDIKREHVAFFKHFAATAGKLKVIAEKELAQKEMSKEELKFLEEVVQLSMGCGGPRRYTGWYPGLFYSGRSSSEKWDALVADVHTNVPAPIVGDPGCVLHQGVGNVDLLVIAVDNG